MVIYLHIVFDQRVVDDVSGYVDSGRKNHFIESYISVVLCSSFFLNDQIRYDYKVFKFTARLLLWLPCVPIAL